MKPSLLSSSSDYQIDPSFPLDEVLVFLVFFIFAHVAVKVLVDPMDLFDDNFQNFDFTDDGKLKIDFEEFASAEKSLFSDTSSLNLSGEEEKDTSEEAKQSTTLSRTKKRERQEEVRIEIGKDAVLPKDIELEISNLDVFEDYVQRLKSERTLTKDEKHGLQQQRKRVRNRLYAIQKRQKEKESKMLEQNLVSKLQVENESLKREVLFLRDENHKLKHALSKYVGNHGNNNHGGGVSLRTGGLSLFVVVLTFSFFFSPISLRYSATHSTGRVLMSKGEHKWQGANQFIQYCSSALQALLSSQSLVSYVPYDETGFSIPLNSVVDASYCGFMNATHAEYFWALETRYNCTVKRELKTKPPLIFIASN